MWQQNTPSNWKDANKFKINWSVEVKIMAVSSQLGASLALLQILVAGWHVYH